MQFVDGAGQVAAYTLTGTWTDGQLYDVTVGEWNGDGKSDCAVVLPVVKV